LRDFAHKGRGPWRALFSRAIRYALIAVCGALAAGCSSQTVRFYTHFNQPGALAAGAPVVSLGSSIGSVANVDRDYNGGADVTLDVDRNDAYQVRKDSIMVLSDNPSGATIDVLSPNPSSPPADPGATIDGASNQQDANVLLAAKNLSAMAPAMAMILSAGANANAAGASNASPAMALMQAQIAAIQAQYLAAGASGAAAAAQQLAAVNRSAAALEQQMIAAGNSAQAAQLRKQIDALARTLATPPGAAAPLAPPSSSGTLVIPPTH
jgi:hypothetical protein